MNGNIAENGIVLSKLVFRIKPRFQIISSSIPNQKEIMEELAKAKMEINSLIAERLVMDSETRGIPSEADRVYMLEEEVYYSLN